MPAPDDEPGTDGFLARETGDSIKPRGQPLG
jgi:hypothetical protein